MVDKIGWRVIVVNWGSIAKFNYICLARTFVRAIGELLGGILVTLQKQKRNFLPNLHLIGHSFGAHIVGFCAQRIKKDLPAGPLVNNLISKI